MHLRTAHHALTPPVLDHGLRHLHARPIVTISSSGNATDTGWLTVGVLCVSQSSSSFRWVARPAARDETSGKTAKIGRSEINREEFEARRKDLEASRR